eukprot:TRINITY_DN16777_c0_g1_i1.p1 TRINITY_DN16777_c0_g1~~TRINITY_DN16777_c0_g1_i1.p1  ORF type:complete len:362 (+),score=46.05 TRINITY_DN16777_c0_g1_i1:374-1459(+)
MVYYFFIFPSSLISTIGLSTYQALLNKASILVGDQDSMANAILFGTILLALTCFFTWRIMWRVVAEKCIRALLSQQSESSTSIMIRNAKINDIEDEKKCVEELICNQIAEFKDKQEDTIAEEIHYKASGWTLAYNIADTYETLSRYMSLCRELEQIEKYREFLKNEKKEGAKYSLERSYPPGSWCTSRMHYDKIKMEVEYLDRKLSEVKKASLNDFDRTTTLFAVFPTIQMCNQYLDTYSAYGSFCPRKSLSFNGEKVTIQRAAEVHQIEWENMHLTNCSVICKSVLSWLLVIFTTGAAIGASYGLSITLNDKSATASSGDPIMIFLVVFTGIIIIIQDKLLAQLLLIFNPAYHTTLNANQ